MYSANGVKHYQKPINPDPVFLGRFFSTWKLKEKDIRISKAIQRANL